MDRQTDRQTGVCLFEMSVDTSVPHSTGTIKPQILLASVIKGRYAELLYTFKISVMKHYNA